MAIAFDVAGNSAINTFGVTSVTTGSVTIAGTANRAAFLFLGQYTNTSSGFTSVCGGVNGSAISGTDSGSAQNRRALAHQVIAPASGSQTANMQWTTANDALLQLAVFNGVDQTTPFTGGTTTNGTTGAPSVTPSAGGAGDLSIAGLNANFTINNPTQTVVVGPNSNGSHVMQTTRGATGATHGWDDGFAIYATSGANIKVAASSSIVGPLIGGRLVDGGALMRGRLVG